MAEPQVIDIGRVDGEPTITLNKDPIPTEPMTESAGSTPKSVNFGPGIELLMNEKKKGDGSGTPTSEINLADLNKLENELNDLADTTTPKKPSMREARTSLFKDIPGENEKVTLDNVPSSNEPVQIADNKPNLGESTANVEKDNKNRDGYPKFTNIPMNPDVKVPSTPRISPEELLREKFKFLKKLEQLEKRGIHLTKHYTMESSLEEMQGEYETIKEEREKVNSVKFQGKLLMAFVTGLEFLNNKFDPFDLKLDGWAEQVNENVDDYDEIFGELHEKYKSKARMAPELKLLFQLGGSAIMLHMSNSIFKSAIPNMDDIMKQNPELMNQFTQAAVDSMSDSSPGFSGFMNNMMNPEGPPTHVRPPPPPQSPHTDAPPDMLPNRPDINIARGHTDDGINIEENYQNIHEPERSVKHQRPDMKGPSDLNVILSGLKTKQINIQDKKPTDNESTISVTELKETTASLDSHRPKRSKRRVISDKNTVSLDL